MEMIVNRENTIRRGSEKDKPKDLRLLILSILFWKPRRGSVGLR